MMKFKMSLLSLVLSAATAATCFANVYYGAGQDFAKINLANQGRFFATSDYDYVPGEKDKYMDWSGHTLYTRGTKEGAKVPNRQPWLSGDGDVLFGIKFDKLPEVAGWTNGLVKVDRLIVQWRGNVPQPGDFGGFIIDQEGNRIRLPIDKATRIYPYDVTNIRFDPTTIKALYLGKRNGIVEVERIILLPAYEKSVINNMRVVQNECCNVYMSSGSPGTVESIVPWNPGVEGGFRYRPGREGAFLNSLRPYLEVKGKRIYAQAALQPVDIREARDGDEIHFTLQFNIPASVLVKVRMDCSRDENNGVVIAYACADLPPDARLGVEMNCGTYYFREVFPKENRFELSGGTHSFATTIGRLDLKLEGLKTVVGQKGEKDIQLSALADGKTISLTILPPFLSKIKYPEMPVAWYDSPAGNKDDSDTPPFKKEDLELLETINCGNPDDPHTAYDISNDPLIKNIDDKAWQEKNGPYGLGRKYFAEYIKYPPQSVPLIDVPEKGRVPIVEIGGRKCRAIGDYYGTYLRYDLNTKFERGVPYLLVIEHAFDKLRRGTFGIKSFYVFAPINAGLDTGILTHDGKYHRESVMFQYSDPDPLRRSGDFYNINPAFLWICNAWMQGGWLKSDGPAISKIEIYKVKRIPKLALGAGLPEPAARRHLGILTQVPSFRTLREDSWLVGFDQVWVNIVPPACLTVGKTTWTGYPTDCVESGFHPGTPEGYQWMLERFQQTGNSSFKVYLSHLLKHGGVMNGKSGTAFARIGSTEPAPCYESDAIPFKPTREERAYISQALKAALEKFGRYDSLDMIGMGEFGEESSLSLRNLSDFVKDTGAKLEPTPVPSENFKRILNADPETRRRWIEWAGKNRFLKNKMLLDELRKYRPAAALMLNSSWMGPVGATYFDRKVLGLQDAMEKAGIANLGDYLKLLGFDWTLYKGVPGFAFQLNAPFPTMTLDNYGWRVPDTPKYIANYYQEAWFADFKASFSAGLSIYMNLCHVENSTPFLSHSAYFMKNQTEMRWAMVEAAMQNPRCIYLGSYIDPWLTRTEDVRMFAAPFRMLPFAKPTESDIGVQGPEGVSIRKYGQRYALFNAQDNRAEVVLSLPKGSAGLYDLSSGAAEKMKSSTTGGLIQVKITMEPWSLKTLASETR